MIERVPNIARLHRVPVPHTNEATYVIDEDGRRWVAKRELDMGFEALLAEAMTWLLAVEIQAPVPHAAICEHPAERRDALASGGGIHAHQPRSAGYRVGLGRLRAQ